MWRILHKLCAKSLSSYVLLNTGNERYGRDWVGQTQSLQMPWDHIICDMKLPMVSAAWFCIWRVVWVYVRKVNPAS